MHSRAPRQRRKTPTSLPAITNRSWRLTEIALTERLHNAEESGQLKAGTPASTVVELIVGTLLYRILTRQPLSPEFVRELVEILFEGIET